MISLVAVALLVLVAGYALKVYRQFSRNLVAAKASGIKYTVVPFFLVNRLYQLLTVLIVPLMRRLPVSWTDPWFDLTLEWGWIRRYEPFKRFGSDTFITVTPEKNVLYTADADVICQITNRRNDFPKALEVYDSLRLYGNNVVTSEGQLWRHHRKIVSPPFSEKNNHLVFAETLSQSQDMVDSWTDGNKEASKSIHTVADDAMRLSLHVISQAAFGVKLEWPGKRKAAGNGNVKGGHDITSSSSIPKGHTMTYTDALGMLLHNVLAILIVPRFILKRLPLGWARVAYTSYVEWGRYMNELFQSKKAAVLEGTEGDSLDLMVAMIKGAGITKGSASNGQSPTQTLTDEEILGNAFVFILAGHETAANSIHFCLVLLAINIASQRHLQRDLDEIFQGRPVSQWDYDEVVPKLFGSMAGAVMNEELRLLAPVVGIPKCTAKNSPQPLTVDGKKCTVPENVYIQLTSPAVHRNPKYWPTGPPSDPAHPAHPLSNTDNDLEEFKPERWLLHPDSDHKPATAALPTQPSDTDTDASTLGLSLGLNTASDTSPSLFRPPRGAYIPFSEGYRSCIGRRFAQVEILAVLALIFTHYSVELAVDAYASDDAVAKMSVGEKRDVWGRAKREVERQLREDMGSIITLQLRRGDVGLRFVRRGGERFDWG